MSNHNDFNSFHDNDCDLKCNYIAKIVNIIAMSLFGQIVHLDRIYTLKHPYIYIVAVTY